MPIAIEEVNVTNPLATGRFLMMFDLDAHDGRGAIAWTNDPEEAIHFAGYEEAIAFQRQQSSVRPLREDGEPNRPLTAYTISFTDVGPEASAKRAADAADPRRPPPRIVKLTGGSAPIKKADKEHRPFWPRIGRLW